MRMGGASCQMFSPPKNRFARSALECDASSHRFGMRCGRSKATRGRAALLKLSRNAATQSCESNQFALLQIRQGFAYICGKRVRVRFIFLSQFTNDLAQCSSVAAGKNFVRGFV